MAADFRELAMHGSVMPARDLASKCDVHQLEPTSGRSALHKAAFWGHNDMVQFLLKECKINPNVQDNYGDTALHDAARFGHDGVVRLLLAGGANTSLRNKAGKDAAQIAQEHSKTEVLNMLRGARSKF